MDDSGDIGISQLFSEDTSQESTATSTHGFQNQDVAIPEHSPDESITSDSSDLQNQDVAIGFVHNVSPLKKGDYFDFQLQLKNRTVRGVCFSPSKRRLLSEYGNNEKPVKIQKFDLDTSRNAEDVILKDETSIEAARNVDFIKTDLPTTITLSTIKTLCVGQLVSVKAKVVHLRETSVVKSSNLRMREGIIADPTGTMKIIFWQEFTEEIEEGCTYQLKNIRIKKDHLHKEVYVNTAKIGTRIDETSPFAEPLPISHEMQQHYLTKTVDGEVVAVEKVASYLSCCKCNAKISPNNAKIVECHSCHLKQKASACAKKWYAHILFQTRENTSLTLTVFQNILQDIMEQSKTTIVNESQITEILLTIPDVQLTYNSKTKVITNIIIKNVY